MAQMIESNNTIKGPKKILHINEVAFALPDDFNGTIRDAMKLFLEYHNKTISENTPEIKTDYSRLFTPMGILSITKDKMKCCVEAKIYELNDEGYYVEVDSDKI